MNRIELATLLLVVTSACELQGAARQAPEPGSSIVSEEAVTAELSLALSSSRLLTQLTPLETRALCAETGREIDLCAVAGRRLTNPVQCNAVVARCRSERPGPRTDCRDARFDFPAPCSASVGDYLGCVKAWSRGQTCTIDTILSEQSPEECLPLLQKCPYMESEFGPASRIIRRCDANSPLRVDDQDDIVGLDCGRPRPTRMVTLGDSIAACFAGSDYSSCAPTLISEYVRDRHVPGLSYQSFAVPGAITADVLTQAARVPTGAGHLLLWIYVGGNDLTRCQLPTLPEAQACIDSLLPRLSSQWSQIFDYFSDPQRFPDGVTFMTNTQYSLWDQCTHPRGPERGLFAEATLQRFGRDVIMQPALARADVVAIDQYPDFLGHAGNANHRDCPHCYRDDNRSWLLDGTHPNEPGSQHIVDKWKLAIDRMYGETCQ